MSCYSIYTKWSIDMKRSELRQIIKEEILSEASMKKLDAYVIYCPQVKGYVGGDRPDTPRDNPPKFYKEKQADRLIKTYQNWQKKYLENPNKYDYFEEKDPKKVASLTWEKYVLVPVKA